MGLDHVLAPDSEAPHPHPHHHHHDDGHHRHDHRAEHRRLVLTTLIVGLLLLGHLLYPLWDPSRSWPLGLPFGLLAAILGGGRIVFQALLALFEGKVGADIALAIATIAAAALGEYFVAAEVVFIALLGECLEAYAFGRAQRAIHKLLDLKPRFARVRRNGQEVEVPAQDLTIGDLIIIRPGDRIAADGTVLAGRSAVDQSTLTGESLPVDKGPGDSVYTGTINAFGRLEVKAERLGAQTTLGQVITLLAEAQKRKSPLERTADRYARLFLPGVLAAAAAVFLLTNLGPVADLFRSGALTRRLDILPTLAVLVVACPCALILATPAAVLATTARLARKGVLVKGGAAIEELAAVNCLAFDKTGTLTEGRPELADLVPIEGFDPDDLVRLGAAAEQSSEHPLARLLVAEAALRGLQLPQVADFQAHPGAGVSATIEGQDVLVGNLRLFQERSVPLSPQAEAVIQRLDQAGQTALLIAVAGRAVGVVGARDRLRPEAPQVVQRLKDMGLTDQVILTGDRLAPARALAARVGLTQVEAELTPAGKAQWIQNARQQGRSIAMIGDGINDAPALALANAGIALGGVGSDIAAEAGSIVLMGDPLNPLPEAIELARRAVRIIRQNILLFAFGLNAVAILLAGLRVLGPVSAAILHQVGSFLVIMNSIRLLGTEGFAEFGPVRLARRFLHALSPSSVSAWTRSHRRAIATTLGLLALAAYSLSGLTRIDTDQVGLLKRFGRFHPPLLQPGLHLRFPVPVESVVEVQPDLIRVARIGLAGSSSRGGYSIAWSASHGERREESALFLTGDENLVELAAIVEYRYGMKALENLLFRVASPDALVEASAEAAFRALVGNVTLEDLLVANRSGFEELVRMELLRRLESAGLSVQVEQVRVVDAHPPREVVPAYRDVSAAVSDAERYSNEAQAYASQQQQTALAEAKSLRDAAEAQSLQLTSRASGEHDAFLAKQQAQASHPELTRFRTLWDTFQSTFAARPKIILDPKAQGRRVLWLSSPERFRSTGALDSLSVPSLPLDSPGDDRPQD